jgi:hypothetical protein
MEPNDRSLGLADISRADRAGARAGRVGRSRLRLPRLLAVTAALALTVGACAAAKGPGVATLDSPSASASLDPAASPSATVDPYQAALAYSQCMRSHGLTDFPDPVAQAGGGVGLAIKGGPGTGLDPNSATFQAAQEACQSLLPAMKNGKAGGQVDPQVKQQALAFSQCMRDHGVTDFPDPQFNGNGVILGGPGQVKIDPNSPTFQAAQQACQSLLPGAGGGLKSGGSGSSDSSGPVTTSRP